MVALRLLGLNLKMIVCPFLVPFFKPSPNFLNLFMNFLYDRRNFVNLRQNLVNLNSRRGSRNERGVERPERVREESKVYGRETDSQEKLDNEREK